MLIRISPFAAAACALLAAGCSPKAAQTAAPAINDKVFSVTPDSLKVKAGIVAGELSGLKVLERVEEGTGRVDTPPHLSGKLMLRNLSPDQSVMLGGGKLVYLDAHGQPIQLEVGRTPPQISLTEAYGSSSAHLEPGENLSRDVDVDFPEAALKDGALKDIRVQVKYTAQPFKREALDFPVSLSLKQARAD
ncbi:MAG TPA: hypothetical protein VFJ70_07015 [Burkholderiales bacterium]|nr:hypothetical protein [Burkholderiales bacterium]